MMAYLVHLEKFSDRSRRAKEYGIYSIGKKGANEGLGIEKGHNGMDFQEK